MNDEIKEILDRLERIDHKEYSCGFEFADSGSFDEDCRCFEERKVLANYITNLQQEIGRQSKVQVILDDMLVNCKQENKELKKKLDRRYYKNEYEKIKKENERLKENNSNMQEEMARVWEENERLKEIKPCMLNFQECYIVKDYKSRCEAVIEYIKEHIRIDDEYPDYMEMLIEERDILLNILQNGSEDNEC